MLNESAHVWRCVLVFFVRGKDGGCVSEEPSGGGGGVRVWRSPLETARWRLFIGVYEVR